MAQVAGGAFRMGSDAPHPEERPAHDVTVDDFRIDRRVVAIADFAAFVAAACAAWAGTELPTEAEREYAAWGGLEDAPHCRGDEFTPDGRRMANVWQGEFPGGTSHIGFRCVLRSASRERTQAAKMNRGRRCSGA
jgi:formylglycine-generating enzyme required for sulfatase activity